MSYHSKFGEIVSTIYHAVISKKNILQDQVFYFIEKLAGVEDIFGDMSEITDYKAMRRRMEEIWQYREWEGMTAEQAFLYGQLYGCIKLCEYGKQERKNKQRLELDAAKYNNKLWLFRAIKESPGIQHKELAAKGEVSPSRLSQIMDEEEMQNLVSYRVSGREKYYFLGPRGKELLERLEQQSQINRAFKQIVWKPTEFPNMVEWELIYDAEDSELICNNSFITEHINEYRKMIKNHAARQMEKPYVYSRNSYGIVENGMGGKDECLEMKNNYSEWMVKLFQNGSKVFSGR